MGEIVRSLGACDGKPVKKLSTPMCLVFFVRVPLNNNPSVGYQAQGLGEGFEGCFFCGFSVASSLNPLGSPVNLNKKGTLFPTIRL